MRTRFLPVAKVFIILSLINAAFLPLSTQVPFGILIFIVLDWPVFLTLGGDEVTERYGVVLEACLTWLSAEPWLLFCSVVLVVVSRIGTSKSGQYHPVQSTQDTLRDGSQER